MRLLALMENARNFAGNRVTRAPCTIRPTRSQPSRRSSNHAYGTHYNTYTRRYFELKKSSCKHHPRKKRTDSTAFKRVLNLRAYEPPKIIVNQILESTPDILDTARAITNIALAQTTASPQCERQTSQTGKGGAHDQDPLNHHQITCKPHHDQQIAPQHGQHDLNLREGSKATAHANKFKQPKFESRHLAGNNREYTRSSTLGHTTTKRASSDRPRWSRRVPIPKATKPQSRLFSNE